MSSLDRMKLRANHRGESQVDRMIKDKLWSFQGSLDRSYQSAVAVLYNSDMPREFKCLINPNKISMEADDKMLSIPYIDTCLTTKKSESTNIQVGDIIEWKETKTFWLVYSQYLQERAYFRGLMRQCENDVIEISGKAYHYYLKGKDEKTIDWQKTKRFVLNDINYNIEIYLPKTDETLTLKRFSKMKLKGKPFEVQAVDDITIDGLLVVYLKEDFTNSFEPVQEPTVKPAVANISGPTIVYPYDLVEYTIREAMGGQWYVSNKNAKIVYQDAEKVKLDIVTGKSGNVKLSYIAQNKEETTLDITISSL